MFAELKAKSASGGVTAGLAKAKKGTATDREVVKREPKKAAPEKEKKWKARFPMKEGYQSMDQYQLAYCYGTRSSRERKEIKIENPRKDAVLIMECEDVEINIVGVCKNISIAGCKRFRVTLDGSIGQVEVSNVQSGYVTVNG